MQTTLKVNLTAHDLIGENKARSLERCATAFQAALLWNVVLKISFEERPVFERTADGGCNVFYKCVADIPDEVFRWAKFSPSQAQLAWAEFAIQFHHDFD